MYLHVCAHEKRTDCSCCNSSGFNFGDNTQLDSVTIYVYVFLTVGIFEEYNIELKLKDFVHQALVQRVLANAKLLCED